MRSSIEIRGRYAHVHTDPLMDQYNYSEEIYQIVKMLENQKYEYIVVYILKNVYNKKGSAYHISKIADVVVLID